MTFFFSLLILFLLIVLTICYAIILYAFAAIMSFLHKKYLRKKTVTSLVPLHIKGHILRIAICISLILTGVYIKERLRWIDEDSPNRQAREFWVAGQTIASVRFASLRLFHPENIAFAPYLALQKLVYDKGIKLVSDGEKYIWHDVWFLYPYSRQDIVPYGVNIDDPSEEMVRLLDQCWEALAGMATQPITDIKMRETFYLKNFPRLSSYYVSFDGFYTGKYRASVKRLLRMPKYVNRQIKLLDWLEALEQEWYRTGIQQTIAEKIPIVDTVRGMTRVDILKNMVRKQLIHGELDCNSIYLKKLHTEFCILMDPRNKNNYLMRLSGVSHAQAIYLYDNLLYSFHGSRSRYLMEEVCHLKLPKEKFFLISNKEYGRRILKSFIKRNDKEELSLIKEKKNGR